MSPNRPATPATPEGRSGSRTTTRTTHQPLAAGEVVDACARSRDRWQPHIGCDQRRQRLGAFGGGMPDHRQPRGRLHRHRLTYRRTKRGHVDPAVRPKHGAPRHQHTRIVPAQTFGFEHPPGDPAELGFRDEHAPAAATAVDSTVSSPITRMTTRFMSANYRANPLWTGVRDRPPHVDGCRSFRCLRLCPSGCATNPSAPPHSPVRRRP